MKHKINGVLAGAFDIIHPGYVRMFKEAKNNCDILTVALHNDPTTERKFKLKPVYSVDERIEILSSIKYIDSIIVYNSENELVQLLDKNNFDIRFLGEDYFGKKYTGDNLNIKVYWISRKHNYSTTMIKEKIFLSVLLKKTLTQKIFLLFAKGIESGKAR